MQRTFTRVARELIWSHTTIHSLIKVNSKRSLSICAPNHSNTRKILINSCDISNLTFIQKTEQHYVQKSRASACLMVICGESAKITNKQIQNKQNSVPLQPLYIFEESEVVILCLCMWLSASRLFEPSLYSSTLLSEELYRYK